MPPAGSGRKKVSDDDMSKLSARERIKRLKELEEQRLKELEDAKKKAESDIATAEELIKETEEELEEEESKEEGLESELAEHVTDNLEDIVGGETRETMEQVESTKAYNRHLGYDTREQHYKHAVNEGGLSHEQFYDTRIGAGATIDERAGGLYAGKQSGGGEDRTYQRAEAEIKDRTTMSQTYTSGDRKAGTAQKVDTEHGTIGSIADRRMYRH